METAKITVIREEKESKNRIIKTAVNVLRNSGIIIYPTETLYGIGADATNKKLVKKVFGIKQRHYDKKFISAVSDIDMTKKYFKVNKDIEKLIKAFMPGPLTIIDENGSSFRMPKDKTVLKIIKKFGKPITSTSANVSESKPIYKIKDIIKTFSGKVDLILDAGNISKRKPSTVFDIKTKQIVRQGQITKEEIMKVLNREKIVLAGGCFNKIHLGHIYFLKKAKSLGDFLIVVLTNDKNNKKPYAIPAKKRKANLEKLKIADKVVIGDAKHYANPVKKYKPKIIALGYDQKLEKGTKNVVRKMKIKIVRIKKYKDYSTCSMN